MKPKRLPRLWCALQGLLPIDACEAAQRAELAWPREDPADSGKTKIDLRPVAAPGEFTSRRTRSGRR